VTPSSYGPSEDETCRQFVLPALDRAGWKEEQIRVQYPINKGRIRATALAPAGTTSDRGLCP
jgi:type I restriction enzyme R subunit